MNGHIIQPSILVYDDEGVGRCHIAAVMIKDNLPNIPVLAVGLREPQSGRTTMHPSVVELLATRYKVDIADEKVTLLKPEHVDEQTIALGLTTTPPPSYLMEKAADVLLAPIDDPGSDLEHMLEFSATRIYYISWLLENVLSKSPERIGQLKDDKGLIIPRYLFEFEPPLLEEEYRWVSFGHTRR